MKIALIGYMASGKSFLGHQLAEALDVRFVDLDRILEDKFLQEPIASFIQSKGELAFRKLERQAMAEIRESDDDLVIATGGGTPCYYDNMLQLNKLTTTIYLNASIKTIARRLIEGREERPLVSHLGDDEVMEFVAKHIFERRAFYSQAKYVLNEEHHSVDHLLKLLKTHDIRPGH